MIGLWIFRAYKLGRTGTYPMDKKPFITRIFFTFNALDNFKDKMASKYRYSGIYPDYCIEYDKVFGTSYKSTNDGDIHSHELIWTRYFKLVKFDNSDWYIYLNKGYHGIDIGLGKYVVYLG